MNTRPLRPVALLLLLGGLAIAGDAPAPVAPAPAPGAPTPSTGPTPTLGIRVDDAAALDGGGLPITNVTAGSTAAAMGLQVGDRLLTCNGAALAKPDDLKAILAKAKLGDAITVELKRRGAAGTEERITARGVLAAPKPLPVQLAELQATIAELRREIDQLKSKPRRNLAETLQELATAARDLQDRLPAAAEEFKKQFPNGRFSVTFSIDIVSDASAPEPFEIKPKGPATAPARP